ncbi:beta-mannosidase [Ekhidna sp.]
MKYLKKIYAVIFVVLLFSCDKQTQVEVTDLNDGWEYRSVNDSSWRSASVPGTVHTDLLQNGEIEDPFYRLNEHDLQWIDKRDWEYRTVFDVKKTDMNADRVELEFLGLDTYSKIYLNDSLILETDNMFRTYKIDVKSLLKSRDNLLVVTLESPIKKGIEKYDALGFTIPVSNNDLAEIGQVEENKQVSIFTRKAGYHFGWDWGPRLVSSGIWRPVRLRTWNNHKIKDLFIQQKSLNEQSASMMAQIDLEVEESDSEVVIDLLLEDEIIQSKTLEVTQASSLITIPFTIDNPKRWWPNGMGDQHLYEITARVSTESSSDTKTRRVGLRTIEVVQEKDSIGASFYFKVNGIPTFMKGANYIPQDVFLSRVDEQDYDRVLKAAKDANMNMLRVWGGGIYENDEFYDKCDELGLLVWQDFMFACAMFPGDPAFLENIRQEAIDNVIRIRNHPSVALWCGNNEVLSAWENWGWKNQVISEQSEEVANTIWKAYDDIFHQILPEVVSEYDGERFYWPSSPGSEFGKKENLVAGDAHYWMVWWGKEPFDNYNKAIPRFMSEFGFQSFPNMPTINKYTTSEDHDIYSEVMKSHQRSSIGNVTIDEYMKRHYRQPKNFESFIYASQVLQAHGIQVGIEAHRRNRARCMGSLYWQINDCWPVASWSSIDYFGNWKALHYQVKRSFQNVIMSFEQTDQKLNIHIVSDSLKNLDAELKLELIDLNGNTQKTWNESLIVRANTSDVYYSIPADELDINTKNTLLTGELKVGNKILASGNLNFIPFKEMELIDPELTYKTTVTKDEIIIELSTKNFAKSIYMTDGTVNNFSDNYFDLLPNTNKRVSIPNNENYDLASFEEKFKVVTLFDSYETEVDSLINDEVQ